MSIESPALTGHVPLWTRSATHHIRTLISSDDRPRRALIVGTAGSGKSTMLRALRRALTTDGTSVVTSHRGLDISAVAATDLLLVDDAHLLSEAQCDALLARLDDQDAEVVVAMRPRPVCPSLQEVNRLLEQTRPAIVLGQISVSDAKSYVGAASIDCEESCLQSIVRLTGGTSWLVAEALSIHDDAECAADEDHRGLSDALNDVIAHRLGAAEPGVRAVVTALCLAADRPAGDPGNDSSALEAAFADGLLGRNGQPVPVVKSAVLAASPLESLIELYARSDGQDSVVAQTMVGLRDRRVASAFLRQADALVHSDPRRAKDLYGFAERCGADPATVALGRARSAWALGDIDGASAHLDAGAPGSDHPLHAAAVDLAAAIWAARGSTETAHAVYESATSDDKAQLTRAMIAALATGHRDVIAARSSVVAARTLPSTLSVSWSLLARGLNGTLDGSSRTALDDLVRASEMYTAASTDAPTPELPAVLAALAAIHVGDAAVAAAVIEDAIEGGHGGRWARGRLLLWKAWISAQRARPFEAESALRSARKEYRSFGPRERLLADGVAVALARRYSDLPGLTEAWRAARDSILRAQFDLFSTLPLSEFVVTAARVGDSDRVRPHFARALAQLEDLGSPPAWSAPLHWTGIQQGILLNRPADLKPHARALVSAAPHNALAATMARAGRVWTDVLAGKVDVDLVEASATGLAAMGMAWDGARLAGHGAGKTDDRRIIARLLACARQIHPREDIPVIAGDEAPAAAPQAPRSDAILSVREREVAELVVQGKTYAEIGESIFISPRTAEHHIARIRRRLGATTRSDLIAKLRSVLVDEDAAGDRSPGETMDLP